MRRRLQMRFVSVVLLLAPLVLLQARPALAGAPPADSGCTAFTGCLTLQTVPAFDHVRFELDSSDGRRIDSATTGPDGFAYLSGWSQLETAELTLKRPRIRGDGYVADFARWGDDAGGHTSRPIEFPNGFTDSMQVGFDVSFWMSRTFVNKTDGSPIDADQITSVQMRRSDSAVIDPFNDASECPAQQGNAATATGRCLLLAMRSFKTKEGLTSSPVTYSIQGVIYDGANIVTGGFNAFTCEWPCDEHDGLYPNGVWRIKTLFYNVSVNVRDRLIGSPTGSSLNLIYPDDHVVSYPLTDGQVDLGEIPRGDYTVVVHGAGLSLKAPMNVSQDSDANLVFLSYIDLLIGLVAVVLFIGGFLWLGRRRFAREGGSTRPAYLDDVYDELAEQEAIREASVTELRPPRAKPDRKVRGGSSPPDPIQPPQPMDDRERAATLEKELELRPRNATPDRTPPHPSMAAAGSPDDVETNGRRGRPMSPQEQAAFHVPTEAEVGAEEAAHPASLPNIVEHRIVELQAVAQAKVAASKRPRFRRGRFPEPAAAGWAEEAPAAGDEEPKPAAGDVPPRTDSVDDSSVSTESSGSDEAVDETAHADGSLGGEATGDATDNVATLDVAQEPQHEEATQETEEASPAAAAAAAGQSARAKRPPGPGRKARTSRQRRPGSSGRGRGRRSGQRRPQPGAASKPKETTAPDGDPAEHPESAGAPPQPHDPFAPKPIDVPEPIRDDAPEPEPDDAAELVSAADDPGNFSPGVPTGHAPRRRAKRAPAVAEDPAIVPYTEDQPTHVNGEAVREADPVEEAGLRPIAGGDGSRSPTFPARRRRPPAHVPDPSVDPEE